MKFDDVLCSCNFYVGILMVIGSGWMAGERGGGSGG